MRATSSSCSLLLAVALVFGGAGCSSSTPDPGSENGGAAAQGAGGASTGGSSTATGGTSSGSGGSGTAGNSAGSGGSAPTAGSGGSGAVAGDGMTGGGAGVTGLGGADGGGAGGAGTSAGGLAGQAGAAMGGSGPQAGTGGVSGPPMHREFIMYNDVPGELLYVNNTTPAMSWTVASGAGRDLQLVGGGRVMLGKGSGWEEFQLSNGARVATVSNLAGTQAAHRLADGTTVVASVQNGGILLRIANATGAVQRQITYPGYGYVRLVRPTKDGTFLVTADTKIFEGNAMGQVIWEVTIPGTNRHVWKAMRLANGNTAIASGYDHTLLIYNPARQLVQTIGANQPASLYLHFFADFHVMPNGNFFVVNSQADRTEDRSIQMLEFDPAGTLVWQQKQPTGVRSLEAVIVLDGVDTTKLQVEPEGVLIPVP